jgi:hypothetical protein
MSPVAHGLIGWWSANVIPLDRRDRLLVFLAGLAADLDGAPLVYSWEAYRTYHHVVCHNGLWAAICTGLVAAVASRRGPAATLAFLSFHLHLACDYFGSGGPGPTVWVLPYFFPWVGGWDAAGSFVGPRWYWNPWQWPLNGWQNLLAAVLALAGTIHVGCRLNRTPLEFVAPRADGRVCAALRTWFGGRPTVEWSPTEAWWVRRGFVVLCVIAAWACVLAGLKAEGLFG